MNPYSKAFYDSIRPGIRTSAAVVVPLVMESLETGSVVDVGCGEGWWAAEFAARGCKVLGVDGPWGDGTAAGIPYRAHDLAEPLPDDLGRFGMAVSLEVAEHLPPARAESFVADLCRLAGVVLFSAAVPGQGGADHVNEQPPAYWASLFELHGFAVSGALRWSIWGNPHVEPWYQQNLLVAARRPGDFPRLLFGTSIAEPMHVVHPVLFDARRRQ